MKLKIYKLEKGPMVLTGSKVLELIQDNYTPHIDILVRESIQNSSDAILDEKAFGKIFFNTGIFNKVQFAHTLESIEDNIINCNDDEECNFLAIKDSNTCGLLGKPVESANGEPNNLYSLVYDIMNRKSSLVSGGSHGIGKSTYYRYGRGICLYYSRTYENGVYQEKLAGVLIQDETKESCFLGKNTSGIAYFGSITNDNKYAPIYDKQQIEEFLNIFGLKTFNEMETGTMVIIPFINKNMMLSNVINDDNKACFWLSNFEDALSMSIQRWYFARLNNESFNGKYLKIAINNKKIELNEFFSTLQALYNGTCLNCKSIDVEGSRFSGVKLGKFNYKIFDKNELGMNPPVNLPSPKYLTDSNYEVDEKGLLFYLRKPGMVINYDNSKFGSYSLDEDNYLIGVFILNDDALYKGENIGGYIRKSEEANHKEWNDINSDKYPSLKSKKPFKQICSSIAKKLSEEFKQTKAVSLEGVNTVLQKKLGEKLLPPSGYGKGAEYGGDGCNVSSSKPLKERKSIIECFGMNIDGTLTYALTVNMKNEETSIIELDVKAGGKSYSFGQWEKMNFDIPCQIVRVDIEELIIEKNKLSDHQNVPLDENYTRRRKKSIEGRDIYKIKGISTENGVPFGFGLNNICGKKLSIKVKLIIKPLDNKYMIGIKVSFKEASL